jgi:hypothetical protein
MNSPDNGNGLDPQPARLDVDADGIPILNEVVKFAPSEAIAGAVDEGSEIPAALRAQLKSRLQAELPVLIEQATAAAIAQATVRLEAEIRDSLGQTLETRLSQLIDETLDQAR